MSVILVIIIIIIIIISVIIIGTGLLNVTMLSGSLSDMRDWTSVRHFWRSVVSWHWTCLTWVTYEHWWWYNVIYNDVNNFKEYSKVKCNNSNIDK